MHLSLEQKEKLLSLTVQTLEGTNIELIEEEKKALLPIDLNFEFSSNSAEERL